jgi:hypothetical protein
LIAGLGGDGSEYHRRELSRVLQAATLGGPTLDIPAYCLAVAAVVRTAIADHLADMIAAAPPGAIDVRGLSRTSHLDALRAFHPDVTWPTAHATVHALATGLPVLTVLPDRYAAFGLDVLVL